MTLKLWIFSFSVLIRTLIPPTASASPFSLDGKWKNSREGEDGCAPSNMKRYRTASSISGAVRWVDGKEGKKIIVKSSILRNTLADDVLRVVEMEKHKAT